MVSDLEIGCSRSVDWGQSESLKREGKGEKTSQFSIFEFLTLVVGLNWNSCEEDESAEAMRMAI